jgi:alpha-2-macroglobulin
MNMILLALTTLNFLSCASQKEEEKTEAPKEEVLQELSDLSLEPSEAPPPIGERAEEQQTSPVAQPEPPKAQKLRIANYKFFNEGQSHCSNPECTILLEFNLPMVENPETGQIPDIRINPPQPGEWKWLSENELAFLPAPGALQHGAKVSVTLYDAVSAHTEAAPLKKWSRAFRVPHFRVEGKTAYWTVVPGKPRFVGFLNKFTMQVGAGPVLLLYDQPVGSESIATKLRIQNNVAERVAHRTSPATDVSYAVEQAFDLGHVVAVHLGSPPQDGQTLLVTVPTAQDSGDGKLEDGTETYGLQADTVFKIEEISFSGHGQGELALGSEGAERCRKASSEGVDSSDCVPLQLRMWMNTDGLFGESQLEGALQIEPAPESRYVSAWGTQGEASFRLQPGTEYRLVLGKDFKDALGNPLSNPKDLAFRTHDLPTELALPPQPSTAESGRAKIELRHLNTGALNVRTSHFSSPRDYVKAVNIGQRPSCGDYVLSGANLVEESISGKVHEAAGNMLNAMLSPEAKMNERASTEHTVKENGLLCIDVTADGVGSMAAKTERSALVQSGDLALTAKVHEGQVFAWLTRLGEPGPVEGARLSVIDNLGNEISSALTDSTGAAGLDAGRFATESGVSETFYLAAEVEGAAPEAAVIRLQENRLSKAWQFGLKSVVPGSTPLKAALFSERGVYRPGETVHVKVMAGPSQSGQKLDLEVTDSRGQQTAMESVGLDAFGGGSIEVPLKDGAAVGQYRISASKDGEVVSSHFRVEEYRIPTFQVKVESEADWIPGQKAEGVLSADYLHGGSLGGRSVTWSASRTLAPFSPSGYYGYVFQLGNNSGLEGEVESGKDRLNGQGELAVAFTASVPSSAGPMRYTLEAAVTDIDRQNYSGRLSKTIHPASFYVGVKAPSRSVVDAGSALEVPIVAVGTDGQAIPGVQVRAKLERIDHHTTTRMGEEGAAQRLNREVTVEQEDCQVVTTAASVSCRFELPEAGRYRVRAWAKDRDSREVQTGFDVTAAGNNPAAWPRFDREQIELVADKPLYRPGDVARLVIQTPFEKATGLLTLERNGVISHRLVEIDGDTPAIEIPITGEHAPNIYASVALIRGRAHEDKDATGFETGAPAFRIGYAELKVETVEQRLGIEVSAAKTAIPGQRIEATIALKDHTGAPVSGQATVMVVDEAVLGLTAHKTPDPVPGLNPEEGLAVRTADSRLELPHARRLRNEKVFPGGGGGEMDGEMPNNMLRKLFKSTAFFDPAVEVGPDGKATVGFDMPDNTTTYRIMAVAIDGKGRAGSSDSKVVVKLPLMVQAVIPRFAYPGDKLQVEALIHNGTDKAGDAKITAEFEGLTQTGGEASQTVRSEPGKVASVKLPVEVTARGTAKIRFKAELGDHADALEVELPILNPGSKRTQVLSAQVTGSEELAISFPADRVPGTSKLEVVASTSSLTELKDAVGYLMRYPNGCIEQTTSTAYPLVVLKDLLPEIGVEVDEAKLEEYTVAGINRILSFQTDGGGLSYWPGGKEPHAFATSFGLTALIEGKKRGYDIPQEALDRMADYLEETLRKGEVTEDIPHGNIADGDTRALFVMTLGRLGRPQPAYVSNLWEQKDKLTPFGLGFLGIAASELQANHPLEEPILAAVRAASSEKEDEAFFEGKPKGGYSMDSPLRSHATALLAYASSDSGPQEMDGKLLNGLLNRRRNGMWGNTQENVFGIMGVHMLATSGASEGAPPKMLLQRNGGDIDLQGMQAPSKGVRRMQYTDSDLQDAAQAFRLENNAGTPINLTVRAEYDVELNEENRKARSEGFTVKRSYSTTEGEDLDLAAIPLGSLVLVRLDVSTSEKLNYVAIDDKLPAGLEPLNTSLATTEKVSTGELTEAAARGLEVLSYSETRDHRVAFFADALPAGEYEFAYVARATTPGTFLRPAASAEAMYLPEIMGATSIDEITIK